MALLDNGMQINTITLGFVKTHSLDIGPLSDLVGGQVTCVGLGNMLTQPMGYIIIWVQVDGVQGYDEDQTALAIPDLSNFVAWVPMILGTPMISHVMNVIKEMEIDALATPWVNARVAYLLAVRWATATVEDNKIAAGVLDLTEYDEVVTTKDTKMIDAFSSYIIHVRARTAYTGMGFNVMTQALHVEDGLLPQGLTIQNAYTVMHGGSKNVAIVVSNSMAYPQTLEEENPSGKSSCSHMGTRATNADWCDQSVRWDPRFPDAKADCEAKRGKTVWGVKSEQIGILATGAGGICLVSLGWIL